MEWKSRPSKWIMALTLIALTTRLWVAFSRTDVSWPDEHFQTLEPASKVVFGYGFLSWEWLTGYRPWVLPAIYMPLFAALKWIGVSGGTLTILSSRAYTALFSTWACLRLHRSLELCGVSKAARLSAFAVLALSPPMILWSCSTFADTWAMIALWAVLPEILARVRSGESSTWFWIGVFCGIPAVIKLQMAFWVLGLGVTMIALRVPPRLIAWAVMGGCVDLIALGSLDWLTWGKPFHSLIEQVSKGHSISVLQSVDPWWQYFPLIVENQGGYLIGALVLLAGASLWRGFRGTLPHPLNGKRIELTVVLLPSLLFFGALMGVAHKESRFLLPVLPVLYFLLGLFLNVPLGAIPSRVVFNRPARFILATAALGATTWSIQQSNSTPLFLSHKNVVELENAIYTDRGLSPDGSGCVLYVDLPWEWTRGELILGAPAEIISKRLFTIGENDFQRCRYAIVSLFDEEHFRQFAGKNWKSARLSSNGYTLHKREGH